MDFLPVLAAQSAVNESQVLAGYIAVAASAVLAIAAVITIVCSRRRWGALAALPVAVALTLLSWTWLNDSWQQWCAQHRTQTCQEQTGPLPFID